MLEPARVYNDADGIAWEVRERHQEPGAPALYFESSMAFRRVAHYPTNWRDLSAGELETLSHGK